MFVLSPQALPDDGHRGTVAASTALQSVGERHLWRHFARAGHDGDLPIFVRGDWRHLRDEHRRRHLDTLPSLFCVKEANAARWSASSPMPPRAVQQGAPARRSQSGLRAKLLQRNLDRVRKLAKRQPRATALGSGWRRPA